jgi:purine-binding chemotaxis protein CheW
MTAAYEDNRGADQFLSFFLDDESFAFEVHKVREVLDCSAGVTRVPRMPAFMRGVLNLRGSVLPVVDMGVRFGMGEISETIDTCIIVVEVDVDGESTVLGAMVDAVDEVFEMSAGELEAPPKMGAKLPTEYIKAMAPRGDDFSIVLDADRVLSADEIIAVRKAGAPAEVRKRKTDAG